MSWIWNLFCDFLNVTLSADLMESNFLMLDLSTITGFSFNVLGFLSKTEKQKIAGFIQTLEEQINEKLSEEKKQELAQVLTDVKKTYPK